MKRILYISILTLLFANGLCKAEDPNSIETLNRYLSEILKVADGDDVQDADEAEKSADNAKADTTEKPQKAETPVIDNKTVSDPNVPAENNETEEQQKTTESKTANSDPNLVPAVTEKDTKQSTSELIKQVRKETYTPIEMKSPVKFKSDSGEMDELLAELRSLRFVKVRETSSTNSSLPASEPEISEENSEKPQTQSEIPQENADDEATVKETSLKELIKNNPTRVVDHFALAEALFSAGEKELAAKYYRQALDKYGKNYSKTDPERAWILFQLGNCLYETKPEEAEIIYEQLMREQPNSEWTKCATVKRQVLRWLMNEKPMELIESNPTKN
ncbi:tetratricopeptide repeat protein [Anaerohalosphaera lusitana]|nr:tetratricopeptide repeat protein [Anaerohalosphaera lusitana]